MPVGVSDYLEAPKRSPGVDSHHGPCLLVSTAHTGHSPESRRNHHSLPTDGKQHGGDVASRRRLPRPRHPPLGGSLFRWLWKSKWSCCELPFGEGPRVRSWPPVGTKPLVRQPPRNRGRNSRDLAEGPSPGEPRVRPQPSRPLPPDRSRHCTQLSRAWAPNPQEV